MHFATSCFRVGSRHPAMNAPSAGPADETRRNLIYQRHDIAIGRSSQMDAIIGVTLRFNKPTRRRRSATTTLRIPVDCLLHLWQSWNVHNSGFVVAVN
jgi:hypothetical protein